METYRDIMLISMHGYSVYVIIIIKEFLIYFMFLLILYVRKVHVSELKYNFYRDETIVTFNHDSSNCPLAHILISVRDHTHRYTVSSATWKTTNADCIGAVNHERRTKIAIVETSITRFPRATLFSTGASCQSRFNYASCNGWIVYRRSYCKRIDER